MRKARSVAWFSHCRVPPPVVVNHVVGPGQVEAGAPGFEGKDEYLRAVGVVLEALHHPVALFPGNSAVQEWGFQAVGLLHVLLQYGPHPGELGEHQHPVPGGQYLVEDFLQAGQLSGAPVDCRVVAQQLAGVVAGLLELGQGVQDGTPAFNALGGLQPGLRLAQHGLVKRCLLPGQVAVLLGLVLVGQVVDDGPVGLEAAQDEGPGGLLEAGRRRSITIGLDGLEVVCA